MTRRGTPLPSGRSGWGQTSLYSLQHLLNEFAHGVFVVRVAVERHAVGHYATDGDGLVTQHAGETGQRGRLHLVVGDAMALILKRFDALVDERRGNRKTEHATLRTIETDRRDGDTHHTVVATDAGSQLLVSADHIRIGRLAGIADIRGQSTLEVEVGDLVAVGIPVEHTIEADADARDDAGATRNVGLEATASADTHHLERVVLGQNLARLEIDVLESVQLVDYDVDIVGTDAVTESGDTLATVGARDGMDLTTGDLALFAVEEGGNHIYAARVATHDDLVGQLLWTEVQMEAAAVAVDDKFRFWNHGIEIKYIC